MEARAGIGAFGLIGVEVGVLLWRSTQIVYRVTVGSASGEVHALESPDKEYVAKLVSAMNQAIAEGGRVAVARAVPLTVGVGRWW